MPDQQECNRSDLHCPPDGRYVFNTDMVFCDDGTLIAKYHKQNLYFEAAFDSPAEYEHVTFDTPLAGKFSIFTCFDVFFYKPSITLIEKYKILASEMQLATPDSTGWDRSSYFMSKKGMSGGLLTAALYGRVYERDYKLV
ncbi:UNVERIFIED_CONTAM: hypothetical protein FKN15_024035 [Acipenser sinensis]